ncbi:dephospho-CoA kinase [Paenibacillus phyllosphaerae]|uniref:Dephospho-CoA kinase n=1 Tax=Paenibacillus phyllosphaerae TaxID=274593 RepID=A0A7W5AWF9_9BACL|nr:dephospho-CoA kinase [Paenibacillus phyllosphaerae]
MNKIILIGSPGSGKSTLARKLGEKLALEVYHLDALMWKPGWVMTAREEHRHSTGTRRSGTMDYRRPLQKHAGRTLASRRHDRAPRSSEVGMSIPSPETYRAIS